MNKDCPLFSTQKLYCYLCDDAEIHKHRPTFLLSLIEEEPSKWNDLFQKFDQSRLHFKSNVEDAQGVAELFNILDNIAKDNNI